VGAGVFSVSEATPLVTKASLKVGCGVAGSVVSMTKGEIVSGVVVATTAGTGDELGTMPPRAVGVAYCPHREVFPPQDASKKEAAINTLKSLFTKKVR